MRFLISPPIRSDIFIFFGIDCTHITCSSEQPSIVSITGSKDSTNTQFSCHVLERNVQKGQIEFEIIKNLYICIADLIRTFLNNTSYLPNKLVFYQIGPDDKSFQKIFDNELSIIQRACRGKYDCSTIESNRQSFLFI